MPAIAFSLWGYVPEAGPDDNMFHSGTDRAERICRTHQDTDSFPRAGFPLKGRNASLRDKRVRIKQACQAVCAEIQQFPDSLTTPMCRSEGFHALYPTLKAGVAVQGRGQGCPRSGSTGCPEHRSNADERTRHGEPPPLAEAEGTKGQGVPPAFCRSTARSGIRFFLKAIHCRRHNVAEGVTGRKKTPPPGMRQEREFDHISPYTMRRYRPACY